MEHKTEVAGSEARDLKKLVNTLRPGPDLPADELAWKVQMMTARTAKVVYNQGNAILKKP